MGTNKILLIVLLIELIAGIAELIHGDIYAVVIAWICVWITAHTMIIISCLNQGTKKRKKHR